MHRVELKVNLSNFFDKKNGTVPNAPCGVESCSALPLSVQDVSAFLMHRVELKAKKV